MFSLVAPHEVLLLEALQQTLHGAVLRAVGGAVELVLDLARGHGAVVPEQFHDGELGVGEGNWVHGGFLAFLA